MMQLNKFGGWLEGSQLESNIVVLCQKNMLQIILASNIPNRKVVLKHFWDIVNARMLFSKKVDSF